jgi:uncharacterized protein YdeI (YjbR/CyaY-like superfamily)
MAPGDLPHDVHAALSADKAAEAAFQRLAPSHAREYVKWVGEAKKADTRARRIAGMVERLKGARTERDDGEG